jgi:hypothetical protein
MLMSRHEKFIVSLSFHYFLLYFASYSYLDSMLLLFIILECFQDRLKWLKNSYYRTIRKSIFCLPATR